MKKEVKKEPPEEGEDIPAPPAEDVKDLPPSSKKSATNVTEKEDTAKRKHSKVGKPHLCVS